jgi:hypothetical protein
MSTSLAVGAVTAVLRSLVEDSIVRHNLAAVLGAAPTVSALPPDRVPNGQGTPDRINLFLFQASENPAIRNAELPSRNGDGERRTNATLALDLYFLITAYGAADFHAEVLLGHAMFTLHETPVLTRRAIRDALAALPASNLADELAAARLADQLEQIRIVPRVLSVEEVSKIWTALQTQYRPTAAYHVSVVLIQAEQPGRTALPVLTRGRFVPALGRDEGVLVQSGLGPPVPTLLGLRAPQQVAIRLGETLTLSGGRLDGTLVRARFRPAREGATLDLDAGPGADDGGFTVQMPPDPPVGPVGPDSPLNPANWQVGVYGVSAVLEQGGVERSTNRLPLVLAPRLDAITPDLVGGQLASIEVQCTPPVRPGQQVALVVGGRELVPRPFAAPTGTLVFDAPAPPEVLPAGTWPVRLRVDGIESLAFDRQAVPPAFLPSQSVSVP